MQGRVLIIAGSDPSGGAGVQADVKTVTALGGYAAAAITALTVQNTTGVKAVKGLEPDFIRDQIAAVLDDIGADAIKIGMIGDVEAAGAIAQVLAEWAGRAPIVLDPVLASTSGHALAAGGMAEALMARLVPIAAVVTPNADEAAALTGLEITSANDLARAGRALRAAGAGAALAKGGHLHGHLVTDVLVDADGDTRFENPRLETRATHGTGCTLASALATGLAGGKPLPKAVRDSIAYVRAAIRAAPGFGAGAGPLNHAFAVRRG